MPSPVPPFLLVSSVTGLVTMLFGFILVRSHGPTAETDARIGTWVFFIGLAVAFIATVVISTLNRYL